MMKIISFKTPLAGFFILTTVDFKTNFILKKTLIFKH